MTDHPRERVAGLRRAAYTSPVLGAIAAAQAAHLESTQIGLAMLAISVALASWLMTIAKGIADAADSRSKAYLDAAIKGFDEAQALLTREVAGRVEWIGAARALSHAKRFAQQIDLEAHCEALELRRAEARRVLHGALDRPAAFFFGGAPDLEIDEAARRSTSTRTVHGRARINFSTAIPETALHEVWEATRWPADYQDPLEAVFNEEEIESHLLLFRGLQSYLRHRRQWKSVAGNLHPRRRPAQSPP